MAADNGIEVSVPGVMSLKNIREKHLNTICGIAVSVAMAFGAFFLWQHDTNAATERRDIAAKIGQGNDRIEQALKQQAEQQRLQTCILFLSLPLDQQQRIKIANPNVCQ
jgi:hypothetical protein